LSGISPARPLARSVVLMRPLLQVRRTDVLEYLATIEQDFREDSTNADRQLTRNRLRHELLPQIRDHFNADVDSALVRLAAQARDAQQFIGMIAAELADKCVAVNRTSSSGGEIAAALSSRAAAMQIDCKVLRDERPVVVREVCRAAWTRAGWPEQAMGFAEWHQLAFLAQSDAEGGTINLPGGIRARRDSDFLFLHAVS
jgi:tRNA(Ile)-lysidine synthase